MCVFFSHEMLLKKRRSFAQPATFRPLEKLECSSSKNNHDLTLESDLEITCVKNYKHLEELYSKLIEFIGLGFYFYVLKK